MQKLREATEQVKERQVPQLFSQDTGIRGWDKTEDSPERPVAQSRTRTAQRVLLGESCGGTLQACVSSGIEGA